MAKKYKIMVRNLSSETGKFVWQELKTVDGENLHFPSIHAATKGVNEYYPSLIHSKSMNNTRIVEVE